MFIIVLIENMSLPIKLKNFIKDQSWIFAKTYAVRKKEGRLPLVNSI